MKWHRYAYNTKLSSQNCEKKKRIGCTTKNQKRT
jgi:hypothetical protein